MPEQAEKTFQAAIFDRDGVLTYFDLPGAKSHFALLLPIDLGELGRRWQAWGEQVGFPQSMEEEKAFFARFWDLLSDDLGLSDAARRQLHATDYLTYVVPYADAHPALAYARSHGLKIGVLSNFTLASLQHSLDATGLGSLVDAAISASVAQIAKPTPQAYLGMAQALGAQPDECLFFDDEPPCVEGALAVGMTAYLVDRQGIHPESGYRTVADLSTLDALLSAGPVK